MSQTHDRVFAYWKRAIYVFYLSPTYSYLLEEYDVSYTFAQQSWRRFETPQSENPTQGTKVLIGIIFDYVHSAKINNNTKHVFYKVVLDFSLKFMSVPILFQICTFS